MRVCHCYGVSDREIAGLAVDGVADVEAVGRFCGAGTDCGGCQREIERLLSEAPVTVRADSVA